MSTIMIHPSVAVLAVVRVTRFSLIWGYSHCKGVGSAGLVMNLVGLWLCVDAMVGLLDLLVLTLRVGHVCCDVLVEMMMLH